MLSVVLPRQGASQHCSLYISSVWTDIAAWPHETQKRTTSLSFQADYSREWVTVHFQPWNTVVVPQTVSSKVLSVIWTEILTDSRAEIGWQGRQAAAGHGAQHQCQV